MRAVKITCDSTCDLTAELYDRSGVEVLPLGVSMGEAFRRDLVDVTREELYDYVRDSGRLPTTSAVSVGEYEEVFSRWAQQGYDVVHISLSSELSACHQNARIAADMTGNVYVVDSRSLSSGSGLLVLLAGELAAAGMTAEEIAHALTEARNRIDASFVVDTLEYLYKGGRCSGMAAFGGNLLKLHPEIKVVDGKLEVGKKYRGGPDRFIPDYVRGRLEGRGDIDTRRIMITHSGVSEEILARVKAEVLALQPFEEVYVTGAGSTISSHCGPGTLGVLFMRQ